MSVLQRELLRGPSRQPVADLFESRFVGVGRFREASELEHDLVRRVPDVKLYGQGLEVEKRALMSRPMAQVD